jgi:hypothetical protein
MLPYLVVGGIIFSGFLLYALESSRVVQGAFERGISLNNRDRIVKERLPIFMEHGDLVLGLGHGGAEYHGFMKDHDAPKTIGRHEAGGFIFNRDEPFALQVFLHFGFVGLALLFLLLAYMVYDLFRINKVRNPCGVSILAGFVGVYLVRGLFEGRYLSGLLFLVIMYLVLRSIIPWLKTQDEASRDPK